MKKAMAILGIVVSVAIIVSGALLMTGNFTEPWGVLYSSNNTDLPTDQDDLSIYLYDNGYATFGGDFFTYVNNNAARAAQAAERAAESSSDAAEASWKIKGVADSTLHLIETAFGLLLISMGAIGVCGFGIVCCNCEKGKKKLAATDTETTGTTLDKQGEIEEKSNGESAGLHDAEEQIASDANLTEESAELHDAEAQNVSDANPNEESAERNDVEEQSVSDTDQTEESAEPHDVN